MLRLWDSNRRLGGALLACAALACAVLPSAPAAAEERAHQLGRRDPLLPFRLDGHIAATWEGSFGLGARADFPLISGTLRYSARDELALSVGADLTFLSTESGRGLDVYPTAVLQWSLGVSDRLAFYPELGVIAYVEDRSWEKLLPNVGFGARYYLRRTFGLHGRMGWPIALSLGAIF